jgi:hypothetical protein
MILLLGFELLACTECRHHFVRRPRPYALHCKRCGGRMVRLSLSVDHRDIAGLPMAQPAIGCEPDVMSLPDRAVA